MSLFVFLQLSTSGDAFSHSYLKHHVVMMTDLHHGSTIIKMACLKYQVVMMTDLHHGSTIMKMACLKYQVVMMTVLHHGSTIMKMACLKHQVVVITKIYFYYYYYYYYYNYVIDQLLKVAIGDQPRFSSATCTMVVPS